MDNEVYLKKNEKIIQITPFNCSNKLIGFFMLTNLGNVYSKLVSSSGERITKEIECIRRGDKR